MRILEDLTAEARQFFSNLRGNPISSSDTPGEVRRFLDERYDLRRPVELEKVLRDVSEMFHRWNPHVTHPRHFGPSASGVDVSSVVAEALVALYNPQLTTWEQSPAGNEIEQFTLARLAEAFGYDAERAAYHFTTGGSEANHTAVVVALAHRFPRFRDEGLACLAAPPVVYLSEDGHPSFVKAAQGAGLGRRGVRRIPVREDLKMDLEALALRFDRDVDQGLTPLMVVATAGTPSAGAIDPLPELAEFCHARGLWFHVDAASGGAAAFSETLRPALAGIEDADSFACDSHSWLSVPSGASMYFCRHPESVRQAFEVETHAVDGVAHGGCGDPCQTTAQWERRCTGLKVFMMMAELGMPCLAWRLEHQARIGDYLRQRLAARGWRLLNSTPLPVVCFTHPRIESGEVRMDELVHALARGQVGWISRTVLAGGTPALHASITNFNTQEGDVDVLVEGLEQVLNELALPLAA